MRKTRRYGLYAMLVMLALLTLLVGCTTAPTDEEESVSKENYVTLVENGTSDYQLVVASKASDSAFTALYNVNRALGSKLKVSPEFDDQAAHEILIGETDRPQTAAVAEKLAAAHTEDAFRFVIAYQEEKLVILSETEDGYSYAADYLIATYIEGKSLAVPPDMVDIQAVLWTDHQAMLDQKDAEREAARLEREKKAEEERLKRLAESLAKAKAENETFDTGAFGTVKTMTSTYAKPILYPEKGQHPRVLFTETDLASIRANLTAEENAAAYEQYLKQSETVTTGKLTRLETDDNVNYNILAAIEAKALRYALTEEEAYGYQAIVAIKNYMLTLHIPDGAILDYSRPLGQVIYTAALVYDWCYDLLTDTDKEQLTAGVETLMGPKMEVGFPPSKQGAITGHATEAQVLRDWYAFAIAAYDEYPDIYEFVAGRICEQFVPASDFYLASGSHWQGSAYGPYRLYFLLFAEALCRGMTDEDVHLFSDGMRQASETYIHYIRPDGQSIRVGDDFNEENGKTYGTGSFYLPAYLSAMIYDDPILKGFAKTGMKEFTSFGTSNSYISPVMHLILNKPDLAAGDPKTLSLTVENGSPLGSIIARSSWEKEDTAMVYMKVGEAYSANHEHKDAGSFQIYYNGILASDSGSYFWYGTNHDWAYHKQTISSNSLLVYNPNMKNQSSWVYSGGQRINRNGEFTTLNSWIASGAHEQAKILGMQSVTEGTPGKDEVYRYSYLAGDLTNAYDSATVEEVSRYMLSAMTEEEDCPMVFVTYDRITAREADYKKTFLLHVQEEPQLTEDGFAIVTNSRHGGTGKLVVQSAITETNMTVIGGQGQEFMVNGKNYPNEKQNAWTDTHIGEFGWGRIEISPAKAAHTDRMLTVMYVTDASNTAAPVKAVEIETDELVGAVLFQRAMLFPKVAGRIEGVRTFTLPGEGESICYIADVHAGSWRVSVNGTAIGEYTVTEQGGNLSFTATPGEITITPVTLSEGTENPKTPTVAEPSPVKITYDMNDQKPSGAGCTLKDGRLYWKNEDAAVGAQFFHSDEFTSKTFTVSVDFALSEGEEPLDFMLRLRPVQRNTIDTVLLSAKDGVVSLVGSDTPVMTIGETAQKLTVVIECDNAGMTKGKAAATGEKTTGSEYMSTLTVKAYVDETLTTSSTIRTYLTFGEGYTYYNGDAAFSSKLYTAQFFSGSGDAGSGAVYADNFVLMDGKPDFAK